MTLDEIKDIVRVSSKYELDWPSQLDEYIEKVYTPVKQAVASGDIVVIDYLTQCTAEERDDVYTGFADGAKEGGCQAAIDLYVDHCKKMGYEIDKSVIKRRIPQNKRLTIV